MAVSAVKSWLDKEVLTHTDLNAEFANIYDNGEDLAWPSTKAKDLNGTELILDVDGDTSITADTDDQIDFKIGGSDVIKMLDTSEETLTLNCNRADNAIGPILSLYRNSASPANNDSIGAIKFLGEDSASAQEEYGRIFCAIIDTTAAAPDGQLIFQTDIAGTLSSRVKIGNGLFTTNATGGDQGADTINASAVYDDGVGPLTDYVFDMALDGTIDVAAYDQTAARPRGNPNGQKRHKPARDYLQRYQGRAINTDSVWQFIQANRRFPNMPQAGDPRISIGEGVQKVLEVCEEQAVLIEELNQRLKAIGA